MPGDPNEMITLDAGKVYQMRVKDAATADGSARQKWIFEKVAGTDNRYKIKNKATGFYLTVINSQVVQQKSVDMPNQLWDMNNEYGLTWTILSVSNGKALRLDQGEQPKLGVSDYSQFALIGLASYAANIKQGSEQIRDGKDYYLCNWSYHATDPVSGNKLGGILTATDYEAFPGEEVADLPMENQDCGEYADRIR